MAQVEVQEFGEWVTAALVRGEDRDPGALLAGYVEYVAAEVDRQKEIRGLKRDQGRIATRIADLERESHMHKLVG